MLVGVFGLLVGAARFVNQHSAREFEYARKATAQEFSALRSENSFQHAEGRIRIEGARAQITALQADMTEVRERTARLEGGQAWLASALPAQQ